MPSRRPLRRLLPPRTARRGPVAVALAAIAAGAAPAVMAPPAATAAALATCSSVGVTVTSLGGPNFYIDSGSSPEFRSSYTGYRVTNGGQAGLDDLWVSLSNFTGGSLALASGQSPAQRLGSLAAGGSRSLFWYLTASGLSGTPQNHTVTVYRHDPGLSTSSPLCSTTDGFSSVAGTLAASANKVTGISVSGGAPKLGSTFTVSVTGNTGTIGSGIAGDAESLWMSPAVSQAWPADAFRLVGTSLAISPDGTAPAQTFTDTLRVAGLGSSARPYTASYTFQAVGFTDAATPVKPVQEIASGTQVKHTGSYPASLPAITPPVNDLSVRTTASPGRLDTGGGQVDYTATVTGTAGATIDSFLLTPPSGAQPVAGSSVWAGARVGDPVWRDGTLVFPGPFTVPASGAADLRFSLLLSAAPGAQVSSLLGAIGPSYVGSSASPIDGSNASRITVSVNTSPAAADFDAYVDPGVTSVIDVSPHVSDVDDDPVTVAGASGAGHATVEVSGGSLRYTPDVGYAGDDTVAYQVGDGHGGSGTGTVRVHVVARRAQAIAFGEPDTTDLSVGAPLTLDASADSGLPLRWTSLTPDVCAVDAGAQAATLTATAPGDCTVEADQDGDAVFAPAEPVQRTFTVLPPAADQTDPLPAAPTPGPEQPLPDQAAPEQPAPEQPAPEQPAPEQPAPEQPAPDQPAPDQPAPEQPHQATPPAEQTITFTAPRTVLTGPDPVRLAPVSTSGLPVDVAVVSGGCTVLSRLTGDVNLVGAADTVCTLEATQAGDDTFAPAAPVRQVVTFASAADDRAVMNGPTVTAGSVSVDVAGNDPAGLRLVDVGPAAHGRVAVTGPSHLTYTPDAGFRGADSFRYTVEDPTGRRGSALVRIVVPDAPPSLDGARVSQVAGSTTRVRLHPTDPNSDHLRMTAHVARADADGTEVLVDGSDLVVSTARRVSGRVRVQVQVDDGAGARVTAVVVVRVSPRPVRSASRRLTRAGTDVSWRPATTTGARYEVRSDGRTICVTTDTHCATSAVLGPGRSVTVRVAGRDSTQSVPRPARPVGRHRVLVATVYFDSEQWRLSGDQSRSLANVARRIRGMGFHVAHLAGYTDSDGGEAYNLGLSRHRTRRVSRFLAHHGGIRSRQAWFGYDDPVADNSTAAGKALNRRVEILVRY